MEELVRVLRKDRIIEDPYFDTYVCLDIETTSRPANRVIEIGAVKVIRGRVSRVYTRLVDPGMKIPREITKLTGITDSMVSGRRNIWQVLPELKEFIGSHIIVGHDVIQNDMKNLIAVGGACGIEFDNPVFDTLHFSREFIQGTCGLGSLCELLWVNWEGRHRAANDAMANQEVFEKLKTIHFMVNNENIHLSPKEITRIAKNHGAYSGLNLKFQTAY